MLVTTGRLKGNGTISISMREYNERAAARDEIELEHWDRDIQIDALQRAGVAREDSDVDRASGAKASRPELDNVLRLLRDGDTLKITRLDRLGRSVLHLVTLGAALRERDWWQSSTPITSGSAVGAIGKDLSWPFLRQ